MRALLVALAIVLGAAAVPHLLGPAALAAGEPSSGAVRSLPSSDGSTIHAPAAKSKKKKRKKDKSGSGSNEWAAIDPIGEVNHGKQGLVIHAALSDADRHCTFKIKWPDGSKTSMPDILASADKSCGFTVDVPDNSRNSGEATIELRVIHANGNVVANVSRSFTIK